MVFKINWSLMKIQEDFKESKYVVQIAEELVADRIVSSPTKSTITLAIYWPIVLALDNRA
jgi:hypothetical protein